MTYRTIIALSIACCVSVMGWIFFSSNFDPYIEDSLSLEGSIKQGSNLFRMNCVGCHGISAQGLVGPELSKVTNQISDKAIINQVTKGLTPPMPSFEMDSQSMADLLSYLHSINK